MLIGFLGVLIGILITLPLIIWLKMDPIRIGGDMAEAYEQFNVEPLIVASTDPSIFISQAVVIFILVSLMALYPFYRIKIMKVIEALRP
jgi:ABC-type antimicrobial peptide transport system permease subunit